MKIAFFAPEVVPFAKTGGLADVAGALPLALEEQGQEVIIVMPEYKEVHTAGFNLKKISEDISSTIIGKNIKAYFIGHKGYFNREQLYGDASGDYKDNLERFSYYCQRGITLLKEISFLPDIIHCHDWQASLIPVYLKTAFSADRFYKNIKTVLTIHNLGYQGLFKKEEFPLLKLSQSLFAIDGLEFHDRINILKGGILFSNIITTVSPTYSREIQTKELGFGLEGALLKRKECLFGVLNGLDYSIWNPESDTLIASRYSITEPENKMKNKENLQKICGLPVTQDLPSYGIVSRLAEQKGMDLFAESIDALCRMPLQLVILGTGDVKYHQILSAAAKKYPGLLSLLLKFDNLLAHKIYAGSDAFIMPSKYEPCGLGQLISLRYGSIPVVFKTGGLADTVKETYGFLFAQYKKEDFLEAVKKSLALFKDKAKWSILVENAMKCNFSWEESAKEYLKLYEKAARCP